MFTQPDVLTEMGATREFKGRGLLARFWYTLPKPLGIRDTNPPTMSPDTKVEYDKFIQMLMDIPYATDDSGAIAAHTLKLTDDGFEAWQAYAKKIEPQLLDDGELSNMSDWGEKLVGSMLRISALFHIGDQHDNKRPWDIGIPGETVERATEVAEYLKLHALGALTTMRLNPDVEKAEILLAAIKRINKPMVSARDIFQSAKGNTVFGGRTRDMEEPLALLEEHEFVQLVKADSTGGRPATDRVFVNPEALTFQSLKNGSHYTQKAQKEALDNIMYGGVNAYEHNENRKLISK